MHDAGHAKRLKMLHVIARNPNRDKYSFIDIFIVLPALQLLQSQY